MADRIVPKQIKSLQFRCMLLYRFWWTTQYSVGLLGVFAGTLLTAGSAALVEGAAVSTGTSWLDLYNLMNYAWLCGVLAVVCTSLVTFLGPLQKAQHYWAIYHALDQVCLEYEQGLIDLRSLVNRTALVRGALSFSESTPSIEPVSDKQNNSELVKPIADAKDVGNAGQDLGKRVEVLE